MSTYDSGQLEQFRDAQRLAYQCAEEVAAGLEPGVTEKEAVRRMRTWLEGRGVRDWFHVPFAWFGDRTAFTGFRVPTQFLPTDRRLEVGTAFILDVAPVVGDVCADIGYTSALGDNPVVERILDDLAEHRALILQLVRERRTFRDIYREVDRLAARQGFENRHQAYPARVLAHEVRPAGRGIDPIVVAFGLRGLRSLGRSLLVGARQGWSPLWNGGRRSDHVPQPGLWAVEPHLGFRGVGAKFEELLVITEDDARWLDDDLPHVRRWAERGITTSLTGATA